MKVQKEKKRWPIFLSLFIPLMAIVIAAVIFIGPLVGFDLSKTGMFRSEDTGGADPNRQAEIDELEDQLAVLQTDWQHATNELTVKDAEIAELQSQNEDLEERLENNEWQEEGIVGNVSTEEGLQKAIKSYEQMSPKRAAALLEVMDEEEAYIHIAAMDHNLRGSILGRMEAARAAGILEKIAQEGR